MPPSHFVRVTQSKSLKKVKILGKHLEKYVSLQTRHDKYSITSCVFKTMTYLKKKSYIHCSLLIHLKLTFFCFLFFLCLCLVSLPPLVYKTWWLSIINERTRCEELKFELMKHIWILLCPHRKMMQYTVHAVIFEKWNTE